jgi:hypothetical protein
MAGWLPGLALNHLQTMQGELEREGEPWYGVAERHSQDSLVVTEQGLFCTSGRKF